MTGSDFWRRVLLLGYSPATIGRSLAGAVFGALRPDPVLRAQAVAFLMFLGFFPALLFLFGVIAWLVPGWQDLLEDFRQVLPPGSRRAVLDSLQDATAQPLRLILTGGGGIFLLGPQLMSALNRVFGFIYERENREGFFLSQARWMGVMIVTLIPWVVLALLLIFGRFAHGWFIDVFGQARSDAFEVVFSLGYYAVIYWTGVLVVASLYHYLTPGDGIAWHNVIPGACFAVATWWIVSVGFGFFVQHIALYNVVYGGFAAAIGLLVWMFLSALVILIGARFNAALLHSGEQ